MEVKNEATGWVASFFLWIVDLIYSEASPPPRVASPPPLVESPPPFVESPPPRVESPPPFEPPVLSGAPAPAGLFFLITFLGVLFFEVLFLTVLLTDFFLMIFFAAVLFFEVLFLDLAFLGALFFDALDFVTMGHLLKVYDGCELVSKIGYHNSRGASYSNFGELKRLLFFIDDQGQEIAIHAEDGSLLVVGVVQHSPLDGRHQVHHAEVGLEFECFEDRFGENAVLNILAP